MPPKRKGSAGPKGKEANKPAEETNPRRSSRSASAVATAAVSSGSKRKASPSPAPSRGASKKGRKASPAPVERYYNCVRMRY